MSNKCIVCGEEIPEGRQVCPRCEKLNDLAPWRTIVAFIVAIGLAMFAVWGIVTKNPELLEVFK